MQRLREKSKVLWAILASLLFHLVVALSLATFGGAFARATPVEEKPVELTIVDLSAKPPPAAANPAVCRDGRSEAIGGAPEGQDFRIECQFPCGEQAASYWSGSVADTARKGSALHPNRDASFFSGQRGRKTATNTTAARNEVYTGAESTCYAHTESFGDPENYANAGSCNDAGTGAVCHVDSNAAAAHP